MKMIPISWRWQHISNIKIKIWVWTQIQRNHFRCQMQVLSTRLRNISMNILMRVHTMWGINSRTWSCLGRIMSNHVKRITDIWVPLPSRARRNKFAANLVTIIHKNRRRSVKTGLLEIQWTARAFKKWWTWAHWSPCNRMFKHQNHPSIKNKPTTLITVTLNPA